MSLQAVYSALAMERSEGMRRDWKAVRAAEEHSRFLRIEVVGEGTLQNKMLAKQKERYMAIRAESRSVMGSLKTVTVDFTLC
jgi:uncharacterized Fe-S cluster-containing radical SAM superfamily enzyme